MNDVIAGLIADVADLKAQMHMLLWFVGATLLPVWGGFFNALWKTWVVKKFLEKGENHDKDSRD